MALKIEDYAIIGDCETAALVGLDGSIDWLCWPRIDSSACFAALLGDRENGRWRIGPSGSQVKVSRRYRHETLILETRFETPEGTATLIDFMPILDDSSDLARIVVGETGTVSFDVDIALRFDDGATIPWMSREDARTRIAIAGPNQIALRTGVDLHGEDKHTVGCFSVSAGDRVAFVMTYDRSTSPVPRAIDAETELLRTERFWREFASRVSYEGPWREEVVRSALTLKAMTFRPTGGIVAAVTTSLPEWIGGTRNWDYRFCWLRDATFTLLALMNLGCYGEAEAWRNWLLRAVAGSPEQLQILYGIGGERAVFEREIPWLAGYENSKPVRVGNSAVAQRQLDVHGEIWDALFQGAKGGLRPHPRTRAIGTALLDDLARIWREPDEGIWEVRGPRQHFTHSKVMAWVAFDRAASSDVFAEDKQLTERWRILAETIREEVCERAFDSKLTAFVQAYGSPFLDASVLLMPLVGFLPADDPRIVSTVAAIEQRLMHGDFLLRYDTAQVDDGLPHGEGAFLACSFWLVQVYALQERHADARRLFERLLSIGNDVGLFAEEYDPVAKRMLGNFPQAFSHVGLINAALALTGAEVAKRSDNPPLG